VTISFSNDILHRGVSKRSKSGVVLSVC